MKKFILVALCVNALLLAGRFWQEWRHVALAGGGLTTEQNGDVNGDTRLDMSDAIYLLLHIFRDGPQPVALADSPELVALRGSLAAAEPRLEELDSLGGCTDPMADNFDAAARIDDGSCEYRGCTDPAANNYDPIAEIDDGSCDTPIEIEGFTLSAAANAQGYAEYTHDFSGLTMVRVPGGTFLMGAAENEEGAEGDEGPRHEVTLTPFLIAKYEVNWLDWREMHNRGVVRQPCGGRPNCVESSWCSPAMCWEAPMQAPWYMCRNYCDYAGLSLPSEAQWEYACRAGTDTPYSFGGRLNGQGGHGRGSTDEVFTTPGYFPPSISSSIVGRPNDFGLHHMHGNVKEWCLDVYDVGFYERNEATVIDPVARAEHLGPSDRGIIRTTRGGGRGNLMEGCRSASREGQEMKFEAGFRPVFNLRASPR